MGGGVRVGGLLACMAPVLCAALFLDKAYHIDDPVYLWVAEQIQAHPLDFYGFEKNWSFFDEPMYEINKNPPGVSYFIALAAAVAGWREMALHGAFLAPLLALSCGTFALARLLTAQPVIASLAAMLSPAVVVSSTNVMSDTLTLAFLVWAVVLWIHGLNRSSHGPMFCSAVLMACAALTKYVGVSVVPLLIAYSLARKRNVGAWCLHFLVPVGILLVYQGYSNHLYGMSLLESAVNFSTTYEIDPNAERTPLVAKTVIGLAFMGGSHAAVFFFIPLLWSRKSVILLFAMPAGLVGLLFVMRGDFGSMLMNPAFEATPGVKLQLTVFAVAGVHIFALCWRDYALHRTPESLLLCLWVAGIFVFSTYVNWTINVRTMLPMAPAVGILAARRLEWDTIAPPRWALGTALTAAALLALAVGWSDYRLADAGRIAGERFSARGADLGGDVWIQGNWGVRWYLEAAGAKPFDARSPVIKVNDVVIQPSNNLIYPLPAELVTPIAEDVIPVVSWLSTMDRRLGAGFYTNAWGPLPYAFGAAEPERYTYLRLTPPESPEARP